MSSKPIQQSIDIDIESLRSELHDIEERERELESLLAASIPGAADEASEVLPHSSEGGVVPNTFVLTPDIQAKLNVATNTFTNERTAFELEHSKFTKKIQAHIGTIESMSNGIGQLNTLQGNCDAVLRFIDDYSAITSCLSSVSDSSDAAQASEDQRQRIRSDFQAAVDLVVRFGALMSRSVYKASADNLERMASYRDLVRTELVGALKAELKDSTSKKFVELQRFSKMLGKVYVSEGDATAFLPTLVKLLKAQLVTSLSSATESATTQESSQNAIQTHEKRFKALLNAAYSLLLVYRSLIFEFSIENPEENKDLNEIIRQGRHAAMAELLEACDRAGVSILSQCLNHAVAKVLGKTSTAMEVPEMVWPPPKGVEEHFQVAADELQKMNEFLNFVALM